jgi:tetratricopeptide (TPR) repeat protein
MVESAARQRYLIGEIEPATARQKEAIELYESAGAEVAALNARRRLGRYIWLLGKPEEATQQSDMAIAGLERLPPSPELAYAYSFRSQAIMLVPNFEEGAYWARKAIAVAEQTDAPGALSHAYNNLGLCLTNLGDLAGNDYLRKSLALAIEHNLPDDAGRAYANMSNQGNRIFPFGYDEMERLMREAIEYGQRTIPDGVFDLWLRSGYGEFLLSVGRWSEGEAVLDGIDRGHAGLYLNSEVAALHAQLATHRGRYNEALAMALDIRQSVLNIGDVQAVLPGMLVLAAAQAGLGNLDEAVASLRIGIQRRGDRHEGWISTWYLFEAVDLLSAPSAASAEPDAWRAGIALLAEFAATLAEDVQLNADPAAFAVRGALFGAAVEQLRSLAGRADVPPPELPAVQRAGRAADALALEAEHRRFDGARIRLWLAEEAGDGALLGNAASVFEELGAHPYAARANALAG